VSPHLILIAEENDSARAFLADQLAADGYQTVVADSRRHALHLLATRRPQLVLADLIVLTAGGGELERVRVFDRGGDDVVAKPFSYPELRGRIRALLRRACEPRPVRVSRVGVLTVDHLAREVRIGDQPVVLAAKEYALLRALIADPTRVRTREELLRAVWGLSAEARTRTLDSHAFRLRKKLAAADPGRRLVINVWGVGYRLCDREVRR